MPNAILALHSLTLAHADAIETEHPDLRFVDWKRSQADIPISNPRTESFVIPANGSKVIFDGTRELEVDGTTAFDLAGSTLASDRYRLSHSGGQVPVFRQDRALALDGVELTLTANLNGSLTVEADSGTPFADVEVGDEVLVRGLTTGDASSPFNAVNQGRWQVIGAEGPAITLVRPDGGDFIGLTETVTPTSDDQLIAFSSDGVQVGDKLALSAGFAASALRTFEVLTVTPGSIEFLSSTPIADESDIVPGAAGIAVYADCKRFLRLEADQACVIRLNGGTDNSNVLEPWVAGDPAYVAEFTKVGPVWALTVINKAATSLKLVLISAE